MLVKNTLKAEFLLCNFFFYYSETNFFCILVNFAGLLLSLFLHETTYFGYLPSFSQQCQHVASADRAVRIFVCHSFLIFLCLWAMETLCIKVILYLLLSRSLLLSISVLLAYIFHSAADICNHHLLCAAYLRHTFPYYAVLCPELH